MSSKYFPKNMPYVLRIGYNVCLFVKTIRNFNICHIAIIVANVSAKFNNMVMQYLEVLPE
jgi:hypothetical protein